MWQLRLCAGRISAVSLFAIFISLSIGPDGDPKTLHNGWEHNALAQGACCRDALEFQPRLNAVGMERVLAGQSCHTRPLTICLQAHTALHGGGLHVKLGTVVARLAAVSPWSCCFPTLVHMRLQGPESCITDLRPALCHLCVQLEQSVIVGLIEVPVHQRQ